MNCSIHSQTTEEKRLTTFTDMYGKYMFQIKELILLRTRVVQKVLQMLGFHRYKRLILAKFVMLE